MTNQVAISDQFIKNWGLITYSYLIHQETIRPSVWETELVLGKEVHQCHRKLEEAVKQYEEEVRRYQEHEECIQQPYDEQPEYKHVLVVSGWRVQNVEMYRFFKDMICCQFLKNKIVLSSRAKSNE